MGFIKLMLIAVIISYLCLGISCIYHLIRENFDF